ncbi:ribosome silencing factor [candidate division KSB1 bacterium]
MNKNRPKTGTGKYDTPGLIDRIVELASAKKALDPRLLDLTGLVDFTDGFLIFSGESDVQVRAIADAIKEGLKSDGLQPHHQEGHQNGQWVILDYIDIVVHVFHYQTREFYRLEDLWGDAPAKTPAEEAES